MARSFVVGSLTLSASAGDGVYISSTGCMVTVPTTSGGALSSVRLRSICSTANGDTDGVAICEANQRYGAESRQKVTNMKVLGLASHWRRRRTTSAPLALSVAARALNCVSKWPQRVNNGLDDLTGFIAKTPCGSLMLPAAVGLMFRSLLLSHVPRCFVDRVKSESVGSST